VLDYLYQKLYPVHYVQTHHSAPVFEVVQHLQMIDAEAEATTDLPPEETPKKKKGKKHHWFSHDGIGGWLMQSICSVALNSVKYFIKTNFVLSLISMMVGYRLCIHLPYNTIFGRGKFW